MRTQLLDNRSRQGASIGSRYIRRHTLWAAHGTQACPIRFCRWRTRLSSWTLDALRALEQHPWPGNVTELAHLVRALVERRRSTGPVRRSELPDPVREGPAHRPLSPMEHAERTAILEALRLHGGNKARAAAALGIARATLYRKLRGYRG